MNSSDFEKALAQLPGFFALMTVDGTLVKANTISYGLPDSIIGQSAASLVHPDDQEYWLIKFRLAAYRNEASDFEVRVPVPVEPGWIRIRGRMGPVVIDGETRYVATLFFDVTAGQASSFFDGGVAKFVLSPAERLIVETLLKAGKPLKSRSIAMRAGERPSSSLRSRLSALVERGILSISVSGYEVASKFAAIAEDLIGYMQK